MLNTHPLFVIGHRGAAAHVAENTLASLARAHADGADAVEFDVRRVEDALVLLHDATLDRTTDGRGALATHTLAHVRACRTADGGRVPLFEEALAATERFRMVNVEVKDRDIAERVIDALQAFYARRPLRLVRVLLSSFDAATTAALAARRGAMRIGMLYEHDLDAALSAARGLGAWSLHLPFDAVDERRVRAAHAAGLKVFVYTANADDEFAHCHACGADGVFTDFPDRAVAFNRTLRASQEPQRR